jgi:hypothetical protein
MLLVAVTLFLSAAAVASSKGTPLQVKVLSASSRQFEGPPLVPRNCNWIDISARCYDSKPVNYVENIMVVQKADGHTLEIGCTVYNQWSHCADLPVGQNFQAVLRKHDLEVRYPDQNGKMNEQTYEILKDRTSGH